VRRCPRAQTLLRLLGDLDAAPMLWLLASHTAHKVKVDTFTSGQVEHQYGGRLRDHARSVTPDMT